MPFIPGTFQNDDAEYHGGQDIHGLISGFNAGLRDIVHQCGGGDGTNGVHNPHNDQNQQADQQAGSEDFSHNVYHGGLPDTKQQDQREKQRGEQHGTHARNQRADRHFIGAGCGSRDGQHGADTKHDGTHQQCGGNPPDPACNALRAAAVENGKQGRQRKADISDIVADKTQHPLGTGLQTEIGGKDHVAGAEKHGKQGKSDDKYIAFSRVLHETPPCSVPAEDRLGKKDG